jgi:hypothetical protein
MKRRVKVALVAAAVALPAAAGVYLLRHGYSARDQPSAIRGRWCTSCATFRA